MTRVTATAEKESLRADLVIIGGGGAGLAAAVAAAEIGASVIVLEKRNIPGGNSAMAGYLFGAESPVQKRAMTDTSRDEAYKIIMNWTHLKINPRIIRAFIDRSGDTIRWLEDKGIVFQIIPFYPNQTPLALHDPKGRGAEVTRVLRKNCEDLGVKILVRTEAKEIIKGKEGQVVGVVAQTGHRKFEIMTNSALIATGGYGGNRELIKRYCSYFQDNMKCIGLPNMGDGLQIALGAGAATEGLGMLQMDGPGTPRSVRLMIDANGSEKIGIPLTQIAIEPYMMWVNKDGERFVDEAEGYSPFMASNAVVQQPDALCYALFDSATVQMMSERGLLLGRGVFRELLRSRVPGLERELQLQAEQGTMSVEQVDLELCNGCGVCVSSCPMDIVTLDTIAAEKGEYAPCRMACPAGADIRSYLHLLRIGKADEANAVLREAMPLPAVTGRVCPHPCESECARREVDEAVNINSLERFIADQWLHEKAKLIPRIHTERIAVIGSGPAGLACAYFLTRMGYPVTVFESLPVLGGMLRIGIPEYRLPKDVLDAQIDYIRDIGVEFKPGVTVGRDVKLEDLRKDYQAIFFAVGNQLSRRIDLNGADTGNVLWGLDFLRDASLKGDVKVKDGVVVIGGGNVAVDVALTALRLGAKEVRLVCLESRETMPAFEEEVRQAVAEGVDIIDNWGPQRILFEGEKLTGVQLVCCKSVFDETGEFKPSFDECTTRVLDADMIILAIGQASDLSLIPEGMKLTGKGTVEVDPITLVTSLPGVFAGGEITAGASTVVEAIAAGKRASVSIDRYFRREDLKDGRDTRPVRVKKPPREGILVMPRQQSPLVPVDVRVRNFAEVRAGFDENMAELEMQRCMTCGSRAMIQYVDDCRLCASCERYCPEKAISVVPQKQIDPLVKKADSWDEIARWIGADPETLSASIAEYNIACDRGHDPLFCKERRHLQPLRTAPYYAIKCNLDYLDTIGGIKINERMEVIDNRNKPIPGLYAAGIDAGGWEGDTYCARLAGTTFGFAINSGRIAGENAVR